MRMGMRERVSPYAFADRWRRAMADEWGEPQSQSDEEDTLWRPPSSPTSRPHDTWDEPAPHLVLGRRGGGRRVRKRRRRLRPAAVVPRKTVTRNQGQPEKKKKDDGGSPGEVSSGGVVLLDMGDVPSTATSTSS
jgi:hypothetical protein